MVHYQKEVADLKLIHWLKHEIKKKDDNLSSLSQRLGKSSSFLHRVAEKGDFKASQLLAIGNSLDVNPFEPFFYLLHAQARPTTLEKAQAQRIAELEEKILALEKERDWLKEVVGRR